MDDKRKKKLRDRVIILSLSVRWWYI